MEDPERGEAQRKGALPLFVDLLRVYFPWIVYCKKNPSVL